MEIMDYAYFILIVLTAILIIITYKDEQKLKKHIRQYKEISNNMNDTIKSLNEFKECVNEFNKNTYQIVDSIKEDVFKMKSDLEQIKQKPTSSSKTTKRKTTKKSDSKSE